MDGYRVPVYLPLPAQFEEQKFENSPPDGSDGRVFTVIFFTKVMVGIGIKF
jgi:hypothetical protein